MGISQICGVHRSPKDSGALEEQLTRAIANTPTDVLERVDRNFRSRLVQYIDNEGCHLADVIFKTKRKKFVTCTVS